MNSLDSDLPAPGLVRTAGGGGARRAGDAFNEASTADQSPVSADASAFRSSSASDCETAFDSSAAARRIRSRSSARFASVSALLSASSSCADGPVASRCGERFVVVERFVGDANGPVVCAFLTVSNAADVALSFASAALRAEAAALSPASASTLARRAAVQSALAVLARSSAAFARAAKSSHLTRRSSFLLFAFCSDARAFVSESRDSAKDVLRRFASARARSSCVESSFILSSNSTACFASLASVTRARSSSAATVFLTPSFPALNFAILSLSAPRSSANSDARRASSACVSDL